MKIEVIVYPAVAGRALRWTSISIGPLIGPSAVWEQEQTTDSGVEMPLLALIILRDWNSRYVEEGGGGDESRWSVR